MARKKYCAFIRIIQVLIRLPHIWACSITLLLAGISLYTSYALHDINSTFWSSIFANVFAGLLTGFIVYLIGSLKQLNQLEIEKEKDWLEYLASLIKVYLEDHDKMMHIHFDKFDGDEQIYQIFYDVHMHAYDIHSEIRHMKYDTKIWFNPKKYAKKHLNYDVEAMVSPHNLLHENVMEIHVQKPSSKEIQDYFLSVHWAIKDLNFNIHRTIRELDTYLRELQRTVV